LDCNKATNKQNLALNINKERNLLVAERFISGLVKSNGKHPISTDGGTCIQRLASSSNYLITFIPLMRKASLREPCII
jgi:transposase-like protein